MPFKCVPTQGTFNEEPTQRTFTHFHNQSKQAQLTSFRQDLQNIVTTYIFYSLPCALSFSLPSSLISNNIDVSLSDRLS